MNTSNATRMADFASGIGTGGAVLQIDNDTDRIGIGTDNPQGTLQVGVAITMGGSTGIISAVTYNADSGVNVGSAVTIVGATGVVSATSYYGDGSGLTGISAGSFSSNDTGISTTTAVGIGTTDATGAADPKNTAIVNVGVVTAVTTFSNVVGTSATFTGTVKGGADYTVNNITAVGATFSGTLTYDDVTNVDSVGLVTAQSGVEFGASGVGGTITGTGQAEFAGVVTATTYYGDGSNLSNIVSGVALQASGSDISSGAAATMMNFSGATITNVVSGLSTISISAGITTTYAYAQSGMITLNLGSGTAHEITLAAGISTFTVTGGTVGESHSLIVTQPSSGITTVGFTTYFLWPSGSIPNLSQSSASSEIDMVTFVVKQETGSGITTELLASAGLDYQ